MKKEMKKEASNSGGLVTEVFGEGIRVGLAAIEDDPRWPIPSVDLIEAMMWVGGQFSHVPLVVRRIEGGRYVPVSPVRSFAAHGALIKAGKETDFLVHVCEGLPPEAAVDVHDAVEWYVEPERTGDWMHRYAELKARLQLYNGRPWFVEGFSRFTAAACGTTTVMLTRIQAVATKAVPEVVALVEEGLFTMHAADNAAKLSAEKQRAIVEAIRDEGITDPDRAARVIRRFEDRKVRPVSELVLDVEALSKAVDEGKVSVGVQQALSLQSVAGELVRAAGAK